MISEERLRQAAIVAGKAYTDSIPAPESFYHNFSPAFERKMRRVLRRGNHPVVYRVLQRVAGLLLTIVVSGSILLSVNAEAREVFFRWVSEWTEGAYHYFIPRQETSETTSVNYSLPEIPGGYFLLDSFEPEVGSARYECVNKEGRVFRFTCDLNGDIELYLFANEEERRPTAVNGKSAWFYPAESDKHSNTLIWVDEDTGALLSVSGYFGEEFLIQWAEGVQVSKE